MLVFVSDEIPSIINTEKTYNIKNLTFLDSQDNNLINNITID